MTIITSLFKSVTALALLAGSAAVVVGPITEAANQYVAANDLSSVASAQALAEAIDGGVAPSLDAMTEGDLLGSATKFRVGAVMAYSTNAERTHYVAATQTASGVMVSSDENVKPVLCAQLDQSCLNGVTTDAELLSAAYEWRTF